MTVSLDLWTVRRGAVGQALWHMARDPRTMASMPGLRFHKSLGTGAGRRFTAADADLRQWALLTVWDGDQGPLDGLRAQWDEISVRHSRFTLSPIASHGRWSGQEPFRADPAVSKWDEAVAAITRAKVRIRQWREFQRAIPPVAARLADEPDLLFRIGIGEAPIGLQGTFSVWRSAGALRDFAYRQPEHVAVIDQTRLTNWYSEELFARFAVLDVSGDPRW